MSICLLVIIIYLKEALNKGAFQNRQNGTVVRLTLERRKLVFSIFSEYQDSSGKFSLLCYPVDRDAQIFLSSCCRAGVCILSRTEMAQSKDSPLMIYSSLQSPCIFILNPKISGTRYQRLSCFKRYRQISKISGTHSQNLHVSRLVLQLSLPDLLKPGVKSRMMM